MEQRPYQHLLVEADQGIATLTLNRPARRNALSPVTVNELLWALDDARDDSSVRVVVLAATGGVFCAGGDLADLGGDPAAFPVKGGFGDLLLRLAQLDKPSIAKIGGPAFGGGLGLVASVDFAIAADSASFALPEIRRGLFPMTVMAPLLRLLPRRKLVSMMLTGDPIDAHEAKQLGLLTDIAPVALLDSSVHALARRLAAQSPTAARHGLRALHAQGDLPLEQSLPQLEQALRALLETADAQEGLRAFAEKRPPVWTGR